MPDRPHGTYAKYTAEHCRCDECREANRAYNERRNRQILYGQWQPFVDAEPVRDHVRYLQAAGMGWRRIAAAAGVTSSVVNKLLYGCPSRGAAPSKRLRAATAEAILAVQPSLDALGAHTHVDGAGTRRRLQALVACGWSVAALGRRLGVTPQNMTRLMVAERVYATTARRVITVYDGLWNAPPPRRTSGEKGSVSRALKLARQREWPPPMAWDDESIDDPAAVPDGTELEPGHPSRALPPDDELLWLLEQGETSASIALRFRVKERSVYTAVWRARKDAQLTPAGGTS